MLLEGSDTLEMVVVNQASKRKGRNSKTVHVPGSTAVRMRREEFECCIVLSTVKGSKHMGCVTKFLQDNWPDEHSWWMRDGSSVMGPSCQGR